MTRSLLAAVVLTALAGSGSAYAVEPAAAATATTPQASSPATPAAKQESEKKAKELQAVTVTGSLLPRVEYQTIVPIQTVNIEAENAAGVFSTAGMLQSTAIAMGTTQINNQFSGYVVAGGTGIQPIDLRGLGSQRTLVLLDGQRPGPAGTRGQTGAGFDLNVIPSVILQRIELVKDGSSSLYGSDAVAGVVNLITKERMDKTEFSSSMSFPAHGGGTQATASLGTGWNFDNGNILVAAQFQEQLPLAHKQRDFLKCPQPLVWGTDGNRIDRQDRSITAGTSLSGCSNLYADTIINYFNFGERYNPTRDGSTVGPFPGFAPRPNPSTSYANGGTAYYTDVLNFPFAADGWAINRNRNSSLYASSRFNFGSVGWTNQFLYSHRQTDTRGFRQFFPYVYDPGTNNIWVPIMPYPSNSQVRVDYYYLRTALDGSFGDSFWSWKANATHSRSKGEYSHVGIDARISGDLTYANNTLGVPPINYFDPGILNGSKMGELVDAVGLLSKGNTVYTQSTANAMVNGSLFDLPAGPVDLAFGAEYRRFMIDDQPGPASVNGWEWGYTSAQVTKGSDHVAETFAEIGVPLIADVAGFKSLALDLSARHFKYGSVDKAGTVWKYGLNWQITDSWRLRGTIGTSYRAPGLYELYLGNQSGFDGQLSIDPCIEWGNSTNQFIRQNCAAAGIPSTYAGGGPSAKVVKGGGKGVLKPETSRAKSVGVVYTPTAEFNVALDYFDYDITGQIGTLGALDILRGCYGRPVYPNQFCTYFDRNPGTDPSQPYMITEVRATYININKQRERGFDLQANYNHDFGPVKLVSDLQVTYVTEHYERLFRPSEASGFSSYNFVGDIGQPKTVGIANVRLQRGHWSYNWQGMFVSSTYAHGMDNQLSSYYGVPGTIDIKAGWQLRHNVSVGYGTDDWSLVVGVRNLFDKAPDLISSGAGSRVGNAPLYASQYDWFGRTLFFRANYKF